MIDAQNTLAAFAGEIRRLCEAESVAVLAHLVPPERASLMLTHAGDEVVPELADEGAAWAFLQSQPALAGGPADRSDEMQAFPGADGESLIVGLPLSHILSRPLVHAPPAEERRQLAGVANAPERDGNIWIGVRSGTATERLIALLRQTGPNPPAVPASDGELAGLLSLSARLAWQVYLLARVLQDPVSLLPGRMEFEVFLNRALAAAHESGHPLGLLLINPDDFVMVNHRFGRELGDRAMREMAQRLQHCVRETDGLFRYGGAAFAVVLPGTDLSNTQTAAEKFRRELGESPYLGETLELAFTVGGAVADADSLGKRELEALDMVQRADNALNRAKLSGGGQILLSPMSESAAGLSHFDPLSGIFTTDTEKDYRNMLMLWETVSLVSTTPAPERIARSFVDRLGTRFRPDRLALLRPDDKGELETLATNMRDAAAPDGRATGRDLRLGEAHETLVRQALESGQIERYRHGEADSPLSSTAYAVPLITDERTVGCLFLDGVNRRLQLDSTDLIFLNALTDQVAVALDRAALSAAWIREKEQESRQLGQQVKVLQQALGHSKMVYESRQMQEIVNTLQRVAPSDATVLIIGESGTGKEMLARSVHEFSRRCDGPFVTVDCGAVAHTLLEAELFGHVKGAFTGADSASEGRIVQADGGTLFLDEIGELPLEVQAKLLRFVQEREITPVGGSTTRRVAVRIVAATNRELEDEVAAGRFREDLFYRLQVVTVNAVPLRQRREDILPLAHFFIDKFAALYDSACQHFTPAAEQKLLAHDWPGNVRELQHCIQRAVIMTDNDAVDAADIQLHPRAEISRRTESTPPPAAATVAAGRPASEAAPQQSETAGAPDVWAALQAELAQQVDMALEGNGQRPVPIGRWLQEDLVLTASTASGDVVRRAARLSGVPESTFRRQLDKARAEADAGLASRTEAWSRMSPVLQELVAHAATGDGGDLLDGARLILLRIVQQRVADSATAGASLMGVTPPTYKRWILDQVA